MGRDADRAARACGRDSACRTVRVDPDRRGPARRRRSRCRTSSVGFGTLGSWPDLDLLLVKPFSRSSDGPTRMPISREFFVPLRSWRTLVRRLLSRSNTRQCRALLRSRPGDSCWERLAAHALGVGLILARKPDAIHPGAVEQVADDPDWRGRRLTFGISPLAIRPDDRLLLVDDWVETGSQARTVSSLVTFLGGTLVGVSAIVDHASVETRHELGLVGLLRSTELPSYTGT